MSWIIMGLAIKIYGRDVAAIAGLNTIVQLAVLVLAWLLA